MHELSIALSLLDLAEEQSIRLGGRIAAIHLRLGPLSGVVRSALTSAYELAREGTSLSDADLIVEEVPIVTYCPSCMSEVQPRSVQELCCPACDLPTPEVRGGRELEVVALEVVR